MKRHHLTNNQNNEDYKAITLSLKSWSKNYDLFQNIDSNPKLKPLEPLFYNLAKASELLTSTFNNKSITASNLIILKTAITELKLPYVDVELVIVESLEKLSNYSEQNYLAP